MPDSLAISVSVMPRIRAISPKAAGPGAACFRAENTGEPGRHVSQSIPFRCLLARRRRGGQIDSLIEQRALAEFDSHARSGAWRIHPTPFGDYATARNLIDILPDLPLRALDAMHLAAARGSGADNLATADKTQAEAAAALGSTVHRFY